MGGSYKLSLERPKVTEADRHLQLPFGKIYVHNISPLQLLLYLNRNLDVHLHNTRCENQLHTEYARIRLL